MGWKTALLLVGSEQERKTWMAKIQEQINYATDIVRQKALGTTGNSHPPQPYGPAKPFFCRCF